jgi:hypothetical protein
VSIPPVVRIVEPNLAALPADESAGAGIDWACRAYRRHLISSMRFSNATRNSGKPRIAELALDVITNGWR